MIKISDSLFFTSLTVFLLTACSKTGSDGATGDLPRLDENDDIFPVITFSKPSINQVFSNSDSIVVEGKVTDNKILYKGRVSLINESTSATVAEQTYETHFLQTINFRLAYKSVVSATTEFSVNAEFMYHGLNNSTSSFKVKVNP